MNELPAKIPVERIRVLIRLQEGYGLGDVCLMSVVLKHLQHYRPHWIVDFQCRRGGHFAAVGLCNRAWTDDDPAPVSEYKTVLDIHPHDVLYNWPDRPCTKATTCLHEQFGIDYDPDLGRVEVAVSVPARNAVSRWLESLRTNSIPGEKFPGVVLHYRGGSSAHKKDLEHWQAQDIIAMIRKAGRVPILLDFDDRSDVDDAVKVPRDLGGAEKLAALIGQCEAYVGIDSGPGHVACSTDTPALICWTKNHPAHFFQPAPNVTHLIPVEHRAIQPADDDGVWAYFQRHYDYCDYNGENGLVNYVYAWLADRLHVPATISPPQVFVVRHDLASIVWSLCKMRPIAQGRPIEVIIDGDHNDETALPLVPFLKQFPFIAKVRLEKVHLQQADKPVNVRGKYLYAADGRHDGNRFYMVPENVLQEGKSIEEWLPEYPVDWEFVRDYGYLVQVAEFNAWRQSTLSSNPAAPLPSESGCSVTP